MSNQKEKPLGVLKIERTFEAPVEDVFEAFTKPELMSQWFHAFPRGSARVEADLRVGGKYSIDMIPDSPITVDSASASCVNATNYGEYLEIVPPHRLVFTWIKDGFVDYSVVSLDFQDSGSSTIVTLTHHVPAETVQPHTHGWNACLDNFAKFLA